MGGIETTGRPSWVRSAVQRVRRASPIVALVISAGYGGYAIWSVYHSGRYAAACAAAHRNEEWTRLGRLASAWSEWNPRDGDAWFYQAEAAAGRKDAERAVQCFARIPESHPKAAVALDRRTLLLFGPLNRPFEAVQACEWVLAGSREAMTVVARRKLIFFAAATLQRAVLVNLVRESISLGVARPEDWVYLLTADGPLLPQAHALNTYWRGMHPDCPLFCVADGIRTEEDELLQRFSQHPEALAVQLERSAESGETSSVAELLSHWPPMAVQDWRFLRYWGWLHAATGDLQQAKKSYHESLSLHPLSWRTHAELAVLLRRLEESNEAERHENLAREGRRLSEAVETLAAPIEVPPALIERIIAYASACDVAALPAGPRPSALPAHPGF